MKTVYTAQAPEAIGPYSQAIISGNLVFTSGQIAINPQTGKVEKTDIEGQTVQVLENLKAVLEAAGCSLEKVVKTTCFLADMKDFARFNEILRRLFHRQACKKLCGGKGTAQRSSGGGRSHRRGVIFSLYPHFSENSSCFPKKYLTICRNSFILLGRIGLRKVDFPRWRPYRSTKKNLSKRWQTICRCLRTKLNFTQEEIASMIGVSRHTVISMENKKRPMTWNTFLSLILVFSGNSDTKMLMQVMGILTEELEEFLVPQKKEPSLL